MTAEIFPELHDLVGGNDEVVTLHAADDTKPLKAHPDRPQVLDAGARDAQRRMRHRGEPDPRTHLDMVGPDRLARRAPRRLAVPATGVGAAAL